MELTVVVIESERVLLPLNVSVALKSVVAEAEYVIDAEVVDV